MKIAAILLAFLLSSCDQNNSPPLQPLPEPPVKPARWMLVPAPGTTEIKPDRLFTGAWRIDTQTGATEFCSYSDAVITVKGQILNPPGVSCSVADKPIVLE